MTKYFYTGFCENFLNDLLDNEKSSNVKLINTLPILCQFLTTFCQKRKLQTIFYSFKMAFLQETIFKAWILYAT
jgi:hypothetical protein